MELVIVGATISLLSLSIGFYLGTHVASDKPLSVKQLKKDLGLKPQASILSPLKRSKADELLKDLPMEDL